MGRKRSEIAVMRMRDAVTLLQRMIDEGDISGEALERGVRSMGRLAAAVEEEIKAAPTYDPGRAEGYMKGIWTVRDALKQMSGMGEFSRAMSIADAAEKAAGEAVQILIGRVEDDLVDASIATIDDARRFISEIRAFIEGANDLTDKQKKDALGYVGALDAILCMSEPDIEILKAIGSKLLKLGEKVGSAMIIEAAKKVIELVWPYLF